MNKSLLEKRLKAILGRERENGKSLQYPSLWKKLAELADCKKMEGGRALEAVDTVELAIRFKDRQGEPMKSVLYPVISFDFIV